MSSLDLAHLGSRGSELRGWAGDRGGESIKCAGDVKGDGHPDLVVGARRARGGRAYVVALFLPAALGGLLTVVLAIGVPAARARRMTVALVGDSIVEGGRGGPRSDLADWVRWELRRLHVSVGARGYVAAHGNQYTALPGGQLVSFPWTYSAGWFLDGLGLLPPSRFGANGRMSLSAGGAATVTGRLSGDRFGVLFARSPDAGPFRFSVDGAHTEVSARREVTDGGGLVWLRAPTPVPRVSVVTVTGPRYGVLRFTGVLARRATHGGRTQVELSSLGQACACATDPLPRTRREALAALRPEMTLIMLGTNGEGRYVDTHNARIESDVVLGLEKRARIARRHGGRCVVVPHPPNPRPGAIQAEFAKLAKKAAIASRCSFAPIFDGIWNGRTSARLGLTRDGIHPTPAGYRRMSARLARLIVHLVDARRETSAQHQ